MIGKEFNFQPLNVLLEDFNGKQIQELLDEALESHIVEEVLGFIDRFQFSHAMIQETLYQELSTRRKVLLHAQIGEALEEMYDSNIGTHAAELAYHFVEAETVTGTEKLVRYSLLAGEQALAAYAWDDALGHFERALAAKGVDLSGSEQAADQDEAELLVGLGKARSGAKDRQSALQILSTLTRAFDYFLEKGDTERAVAIAVHDVPMPAPGNIVNRALQLVPPHSHDAGRLQAVQIQSLRADYRAASLACSCVLNLANTHAPVPVILVS